MTGNFLFFGIRPLGDHEVLPVQTHRVVLDKADQSAVTEKVLKFWYTNIFDFRWYFFFTLITWSCIKKFVIDKHNGFYKRIIYCYAASQSAFTFSKLTIEILEQAVKYVQSKQRHQKMFILMYFKIQTDQSRITGNAFKKSNIWFIY